jgi:hypothetical protein
MKLARTVLSAIALLLLGAGYVASQASVLTGSQLSYHAKVDQPPIRMLAMLLLVAAVVLAFIPEREAP